MKKQLLSNEKKIKTGLMYSDIFAKYIVSNGYLVLSSNENSWITPNDYYDTPERVTEAYNLLEKTSLLKELIPITPRNATKEELLESHSEKYLNKLEELSKSEGGSVGELAYIGHNGFNIISNAVGGDLEALDAIMTSQINNAFCLQRPPGAHAEKEKGFGFCIVNNFNIITKIARKKYGLKKILIIDFDNHYKKGIEEAWYDTDEVMYAEIHQNGALAENSPADRNADYIGEGKGKGYNIVIPMPSGAGDEAYIKAFEEIIIPIADQYEPELVIVVAGFASNIFDPLCRQQLTVNGYGRLMELINNIAKKHASGKLLAILEGGKGNYMSFCIAKTISVLSEVNTDIPDITEKFIVRNHITYDQKQAIENVKKYLSPYWKL